jgi:uncharacterized protein YukJ
MSSAKWKPVKNYGVWHARPVEYRVEYNEDDSRDPHIFLTFHDESQDDLTAAINIKSTSKGESRLVYWMNDNLDSSILRDFKDLPLGWHKLDGKKGLDYLRDDGLLGKKKGIVLPHDIPGENNDIIEALTPHIERSCNEKATVYIFGAKFNDHQGLHEVHQNQGSLPRYSNSVQKDGALIFHFEEADAGKQWVGVFLAFASQKQPTDNEKGLAKKDSKSWAEILGVEPEESERFDA